MGKRELLLISGFAVIGLLVYQLTMPATADTGGGFGAWWARVRSHVAQNWVERHYERKDEAKVPPAVRTVAVQLDRGSVTILGEPRETVAVEVSGVVFAGDDQMAKALEEQITVGLSTDGPLMKLALTLPKRDDLARRPRVQLTVRVPARLGVELRLGGGELDVTNVAAVQVVKASGRIRIASIAGAVTGELGPGEVEIDQAGSVAIETRSSQVRIANVTGSFEAEARRGDFRARGIGGPAHLEGKDVEAELEDIAGPLHLTGSGGEVRVRDVRGPITAETERTTLKFTPGMAVAITATTEHDAIELTLPAAGILLDAQATGGDIRTPDGLITVQRSGDDAKASGPLRGGGPRVMLRTSRGDITVR
jgi:Putative adhesin